MTAKRWPILDLGDDASEAEIRRAYAARLREQGPDAGVATFQALRAEFEAALATARSGTNVAVASAATTRLPEAWRLSENAAPLRDERREDRERSTRAIDEITQYLKDGDLLRACSRFDRARAANEIGLIAEPEIEQELARGWLADTTLDAATLAEIVRRYRWDDAVSGFAFGSQIAARLRTDAVPALTPGKRFAGKWNWGAFFLTPFWLYAHGLKRRAVTVFVLGLTFLIVPPGWFALLWLAIDHGKHGNVLAANNRTFADDTEFAAVQKIWRDRGMYAFAGTIVCLFIALVWFVAAHG